jgi:hypothetical protein
MYESDLRGNTRIVGAEWQFVGILQPIESGGGGWDSCKVID